MIHALTLNFTISQQPSFSSFRPPMGPFIVYTTSPAGYELDTFTSSLLEPSDKPSELPRSRRKSTVFI